MTADLSRFDGRPRLQSFLSAALAPRGGGRFAPELDRLFWDLRLKGVPDNSAFVAARFLAAYLSVKSSPEFSPSREFELEFLDGPEEFSRPLAWCNSLRRERAAFLAEVDRQAESYLRERRLGRPQQVLIARLLDITFAGSGSGAQICDSLANLVRALAPPAGKHIEETIVERACIGLMELIAPAKMTDDEFARFAVALATGVRPDVLSPRRPQSPATPW